MKGNKKVLAVAILLLLVVVSVGTYAIYASSATGDATVNAAAWRVKVGSTDIVENNSFTLSDIDFTGQGSVNTSGNPNKIAPGSTGTLTILIDADGSEVPVDYQVELGTMQGGSNNFSITAHSGSSLTGTIAYSATDGAMEQTVVLDVTWTGAANDGSEKNTSDTNLEGTAITVPITVTAKQHLGS